MGKVNLKFGQRGSSVAEYMQLLHEIELVDDIKSNTLLCHRDDPILTEQTGNLSSGMTNILMYYWVMNGN